MLGRGTGDILLVAPMGPAGPSITVHYATLTVSQTNAIPAGTDVPIDAGEMNLGGYSVTFGTLAIRNGQVTVISIDSDALIIGDAAAAGKTPPADNSNVARDAGADNQKPPLTGVLEVFSPLPNTFTPQAQVLLLDFADECARICHVAAHVKARPPAPSVPLEEDPIEQDSIASDTMQVALDAGTIAETGSTGAAPARSQAEAQRLRSAASSSATRAAAAASGAAPARVPRRSSAASCAREVS